MEQVETTEVKTITRDQAVMKIFALKANATEKNRTFTVTFIKRTTGERRVINCRFGVTKHLVGGELGYSPIEHRLINVFDMQKRGYRNIAIEGIEQLTINGETFEVK